MQPPTPQKALTLSRKVDECKPLIPGGSPVLGFLLGGVAVGPFTTGLIHNVHQARRFYGTQAPVS